MSNRFYLQALAVTGLFIALLLFIWIASGGPASEAEVRNASSTRTAIAMTEVFLLRPAPTETPLPFILPTFRSETEAPGSTPVPELSATPTGLPFLNPPTLVQTPGIPRTGLQDPTEFARWYFTRVWKERDYQNLWDNYLTPSFKAHVGSGSFDDYAGWWNSVERVDVNSVDMIKNNGTNAWVRVNITIRRKDGHVLPDQVFDYDFLYDAGRGTWMFDYGSQ